MSWEPSDELVQSWGIHEHDIRWCPECSAVRDVLRAAVESGELVPHGEAFFTCHDDGTVELNWTGGRRSWISREMCEQWVATHNQLIAARKVVEAARSVSSITNPKEVQRLFRAIVDYDAPTRTTTEQAKEGDAE